MTRTIAGAFAALVAAASFLVTPAMAAGGYSLFDGATYVSPGHNSNRAVQLTSNSSVPDSGINYSVPSGMTFADIKTLSTDYMFTAGSCGGGSPRFQINVLGKNAFVYIGPPPNYTNCPQNVWVNTGNLATPTSFIDTSQLPGGTFYDTFASADAKYGSAVVTGIQLVADSGWAFPATGQVVQIDNTMINNTLYTYEQTSAEDCKDGGYKNFSTAPGPFKNQGQCVSYFNSNGNHGSDSGNHGGGGD